MTKLVPFAHSLRKSAEGEVVTYACWSFALTSVETGRLLALAAICPDARYVGQLGLPAPNTPRAAPMPGVDHRHASPDQWKEVLHQLKVGLNPGPLPRASAASQMLAGDLNATIVCQYMSHAPIAFDHPHQAIDALDRSLASQVEAYASTPETRQ